MEIGRVMPRGTTRTDRTRLHPFGGTPARSVLNRSLEGGIEILQTSRSFDTFRSDADLLGNGEFAKRTGLSRPTMVRLTQTLVGMGILQQKPAPRGQCLTRSLVCCATRKD